MRIKAIKPFIFLLLAAIISSVCFIIPGCTKTETILKTDTVTIRIAADSMTIVKNLMTGKWFVTHREREVFSGTTSTSKVIEYFTGTNTFNEYKSDMTYNSVYMNGAPTIGTWALVSPNYIVFDKGNATMERYYYILIVDNKVQVIRGPFKKDDTLYSPTEVYTFYSAK